jgi:hypothetical protein
MIYTPSFIKIGSGIQKLIGDDTQTHKHRQHCDLISLLLFFQNKESRLKKRTYIQAPGGIRAHDPSVGALEDIFKASRSTRSSLGIWVITFKYHISVVQVLILGGVIS